MTNQRSKRARTTELGMLKDNGALAYCMRVGQYGVRTLLSTPGPESVVAVLYGRACRLRTAKVDGKGQWSFVNLHQL